MTHKKFKVLAYRLQPDQGIDFLLGEYKGDIGKKSLFLNLHFLNSGLGASKIGCLGLLVCRSVCQKLSKNLKQRDFNVEMKTKYISKVR